MDIELNVLVNVNLYARRLISASNLYARSLALLLTVITEASFLSRGNFYRDPHLGSVQRSRECRTLPRATQISQLLPGLGIIVGEGQKDSKSQRK